MERSVKGAWCLLLSFVFLSFSMSLKDAERLALENFHELRAERLELNKRKQERLERLGKLLPVVNLEASFNLSKKQSFTLNVPPAPPQEFVFQKGSYPKFTLQLKQSLFRLPDFREYEVYKLLERSQVYLLAEKRNEILYRVREAYINALKAKSSLDIYKKHLERVRAHLRDVRELYEEGIVAYKDVLETKVKLYEVREKLASARAGYRKALNYLSYLVGRKVTDVEPIDGNELLMETDYERLIRELEERPILKHARENVRISEKGVQLAGSYFYPEMVLEAVYQRTEESDLFPKDRYLISFVLRWNLLSGLRKLRSLEMAKIQHRQALVRYRDIRDKLELELKNTLEDLEAARVKVEYAEKQLEDAKEHLRIALEKYRAGLGTNTEVLDAQSYLKTAEETLEMSRYNLILKFFKLREVLGYEGR